MEVLSIPNAGRANESYLEYFERHLSGLFFKISNDVGATHSPSNLVQNSAILTTNVDH